MIPLRIDQDGTPICPDPLCIDQRMVETEPDQWMCPLGLRMEEELRVALLAALSVHGEPPETSPEPLPASTQGVRTPTVQNEPVAHTERFVDPAGGHP